MSKEDDENTILSKLRIYFPDGLGSNGYTTNFVKIKSLKRLKINVYSDTDVNLNLEWSIDGINRDMVQEIHIETNKWYTQKVSIVMEYVRFNVVHLSSKINTCLKIIAFSPEDKNIAKPKPQKKNIFSIKKDHGSSSSSPKVLRDERIPPLIFKGGLLIGNDGRNISVLPKGNEGDILMITDGFPAWVPITKLFKNIEDHIITTSTPQDVEKTILPLPDPVDDDFICDGIYDRSIEKQPTIESSNSGPSNIFYEMSYENEPVKKPSRPGSGLGSALSSIHIFGRNKSLTKKPPAFE